MLVSWNGSVEDQTWECPGFGLGRVNVVFGYQLGLNHDGGLAGWVKREAGGTSGATDLELCTSCLGASASGASYKR